MDETPILELPDLGPVYYETDLERVIVEPFNALSSLSMALVAVLIWLLLVKKDYRNHQFLSFIYAPLIFIGGIGSTLFHAFRVTPFFLYLDIIPVFILTILISLFYWHKIYSKWYFVVIMFFVIVFARGIPMRFFEGSTAINISYFLSGLLIIIPMLVFIINNGFSYIRLVVVSVLALLLALLFRYTDDFEQLILPMGTHWLWHVFSGVGAWYLGFYIYRIALVDDSRKSNQINY